MLNTVVFAKNPFDASTWVTVDTDNVLDEIMSQYNSWPINARLYFEHVSLQTDCTPTCEADIESVLAKRGKFYVVEYPSDIITLVIVIAAVAVVAAIALAPSIPNVAMRNTQSNSPNNELAARSNRQRLGGRIPDIYGTRWSTPDLIAVPYTVYQDHQEVEFAYMCVGRGEYAYTASDVYDDTTRVQEIVGTSVEVYGPYTSPNSGHSPQLRIGNSISTPVYNVQRSNAVNGQVLRPENSQTIRGSSNIRFLAPNIIQASGITFTDKFFPGDSLVINSATVTAGGGFTETRAVYFQAPNKIFFVNVSPAGYAVGQAISFTAILSYQVYVSEGESGPVYSTTTVDLSGSYIIEAASYGAYSGGSGEDSWFENRFYVTLEDASTVNANWGTLPAEFPSASTFYSAAYPSASVALSVTSGPSLYSLNGTYTVSTVSGNQLTLLDPATVNDDWLSITTTPYISPVLSTSGPRWIGQFFVNKSDTEEIWCNFIALQGLYKDDGKNQQKFDVVIEIGVTPVDSAGVTTGAEELFQATVVGSSTLRSSRAVTLKANPTFTGRCKVRARRVTPADTAFEGTVVDEIKWKSLYGMTVVPLTHFGNVTTVQAVTFATDGALAVKDRKLRIQVTRKIPTRIAGDSFTTSLTPTNRADEILCAIALDPYIGGRTVNELDVTNIYDTLANVRAYFANSKAGEFNYTFDSTGLSFEETWQMIADSVFCIPYRQGNKLRLLLERATNISTVLFNHRNKIPKSETRSVRFGFKDEFDGVSLTYSDPLDDAQATFYIPEDRSAVRPKEIELPGVRSYDQAYMHAWRAWNKIRFQNMAVEFRATEEAEVVLRGSRILVADNTRSGTQDGEVIEQSGLILTLSRPVDMPSGPTYTIFLQLYDGSVQNIDCTAGADEYHVVLSAPPNLPLVLDTESYSRTTFLLASSDENRADAMLVTERSSGGDTTSTLKAINYDARYYQNDRDRSTSSIPLPPDRPHSA